MAMSASNLSVSGYGMLFKLVDQEEIASLGMGHHPGNNRIGYLLAPQSYVMIIGGTTCAVPIIV